MKAFKLTILITLLFAHPSIAKDSSNWTIKERSLGNLLAVSKVDDTKISVIKKPPNKIDFNRYSAELKKRKDLFLHSGIKNWNMEKLLRSSGSKEIIRTEGNYIDTQGKKTFFKEIHVLGEELVIVLMVTFDKKALNNKYLSKTYEEIFGKSLL